MAKAAKNKVEFGTLYSPKKDERKLKMKKDLGIDLKRGSVAKKPSVIKSAKPKNTIKFSSKQLLEEIVASKCQEEIDDKEDDVGIDVLELDYEFSDEEGSEEVYPSPGPLETITTRPETQETETVMTESVMTESVMTENAKTETVPVTMVVKEVSPPLVSLDLDSITSLRYDKFVSTGVLNDFETDGLRDLKHHANGVSIEKALRKDNARLRKERDMYKNMIMLTEGLPVMINNMKSASKELESATTSLKRQNAHHCLDVNSKLPLPSKHSSSLPHKSSTSLPNKKLSVSLLSKFPTSSTSMRKSSTLFPSKSLTSSTSLHKSATPLPSKPSTSLHKSSTSLPSQYKTPPSSKSSSPTPLKCSSSLNDSHSADPQTTFHQKLPTSTPKQHCSSSLANWLKSPLNPTTGFHSTRPDSPLFSSDAPNIDDDEDNEIMIEDDITNQLKLTDLVSDIQRCKCNHKKPSTLVCDLLMIVFGEAILCQSSLTGGKSRMNLGPPKPKLDTRKVTAIIEYVQNIFPDSEEATMSQLEKTIRFKLNNLTKKNSKKT